MLTKATLTQNDKINTDNDLNEMHEKKDKQQMKAIHLLSGAVDVDADVDGLGVDGADGVDVPDVDAVAVDGFGV